MQVNITYELKLTAKGKSWCVAVPLQIAPSSPQVDNSNDAENDTIDYIWTPVTADQIPANANSLITFAKRIRSNRKCRSLVPFVFKMEVPRRLFCGESSKMSYFVDPLGIVSDNPQDELSVRLIALRVSLLHICRVRGTRRFSVFAKERIFMASAPVSESERWESRDVCVLSRNPAEPHMLEIRPGTQSIPGFTGCNVMLSHRLQIDMVLESSGRRLEKSLLKDVTLEIR